MLLPLAVYSQEPDSSIIQQVDSLIALTEGLVKSGKLKEALPVAIKAKELAVNNLEKKDLRYSTALNDLGTVYLNLHHFDKAEPLLLETKEIRGEILQMKDQNYGLILNNLAVLYINMGKYEEAEYYLLETLEIFGETLGKTNIYYGYVLNHLARLYQRLGRYEEAEPKFQQALEIIEEKVGQSHPSYAYILNALAVLNLEIGRYDRAEWMMLETKKIYEKNRDANLDGYATILNNLAFFYVRIGQYEKAEELYLESKDLRKDFYGENDPKYALSLANLGDLYQNLGRYEEADSLLRIAKIIREEVYGKDHLQYAESLNNLAHLYFEMENYQEADSLFRAAREVFESSVGKSHPQYAANLHNLGFLSIRRNQYEKAEEFLLEAEQIKRNLLGEDNPKYVNSLVSLAALYSLMDRYREADSLFRMASKIQRELISHATTHLSELELETYTQPYERAWGISLSFLIDAYPLHPASTTLAYDELLFRKGFLLENAVGLRQAFRSAPDSIQMLFHKWKGWSRLLSEQYSLPIDERQGLDELEEKANALEKELARTMAGFKEARKQVTWKEVRDSLANDEAAVEFFHFRQWNREWKDSTIYAALVLCPGYESPVFVPLFQEIQLKEMLRVTSEEPQVQVAQLYPSRGAGLASKGPAPDLYRLIWKPLDSLLMGVKKVYYSPSGLLHRISFPALLADSVTYLSERYQLHFTSSTRRLVSGQTEPDTDPTTVAIFGDIDYRGDSITLTEMKMKRDTVKDESLVGASIPDHIILKMQGERGDSCYWKPLPGTRTEMERLMAIFYDHSLYTLMLRSYQASEESFKQFGNTRPVPDILHLATHGYFAPDPQSEDYNREAFLEKSVFRFSEQPMMRSGLILARADAAWCTGHALEGFEDGILTASEISRMDLSGTELAVLSACDTGLGDIKGSEGVYGLQRAFKMAGADYLLLSLWPVSDTEETVSFMETFYTIWLSGLPIREAFHQTQQKMREQYSNPYYWAGFVLIE